MSPTSPLARFASLKVKLGLLVVASILAALIVAFIGRLAGVPGVISMPVTIVAALAVTQWLAKGMVAPLRDMAAAARGMASGDYSERIAVRSKDEVGQLASSFNAMATDLATQDQQRRALIATVSHELRTPLAAQRALLENLADGIVAPDERTLGTALAQAERLSALVSDLLDLSRIDGGGATLDLADVSVADLLAACVAEAQLGGRGISHDVLVEPADLRVRADASRLAQVVANLLDNADRHSSSGGAVRLRASADSRDWTLDVSDEGPGIRPEHRERLFQRFGSTETSTGGSGLGLAISRWICELHGGRIEALDSQRGAHLRVTLPLHPSAGQPVASPTPLAAPQSAISAPPVPPAAPSAAPNLDATAASADLLTQTPAYPPGTQPTRIPPVPVVPTQGPVKDWWGSLWPERVSTPQVVLVSVAAAIGVFAAIVGPLMNGPGLALTLILALGGSVAFVVARAWRSRWSLTIWALCLIGAALFSLRAEPGLTVFGLLLTVPLFMSALTGARTLIGLVMSAFAWPLAALRGLPLLGRTIGVVSQRRSLWSLIRAVGLGLLAIVVFGALFASADAIMGSWVQALIPDWAWSDITLRVFIWIFVTGLVLTAAYVGLNPMPADPSRPNTPRPVRQRIEWVVPTGAVILAFVVFLVAQASALFGGHEHVLRTTGLTYAEYARQGFGQLCVVTALTTLVLALVRMFAPEGNASDRRLKRAIVSTLTLLALLVVASALHRLWLYQGAYGFTTLRIFAVLAELWLALVLVLVAAAALGLTWRYAVRAAALAASALVLGQSLVNVDARVVELNATRYAATGKVDVFYLQQLSMDGAAAIRDNFPAQIAGCALSGWTPEARTPSGWNLAVAQHRDVVYSFASTVEGDPCADFAGTESGAR